MTAEELQAYLHDAIPLSAAMGVRVVDDPDGHRHYVADLGPNLNHRGTAFGGSVSTLAIIAGWARVHTALRAQGLDVHTVIQRNQIEYEAPGTAELKATCEPVADADWQRLLRGLGRRGRGRVRVRVVVRTGERRIASFRGSYVAFAVR